MPELLRGAHHCVGAASLAVADLISDEGVQRVLRERFARLVMCFIKTEGESALRTGGPCARPCAAACCGPPGDHRGRHYESECLADPCRFCTAASLQHRGLCPDTDLEDLSCLR